MNARPVITHSRQDQIIQSAIDGRRRLLLTHQCPDGWRTFKGEFVAGSRSSRVILTKVSLPGDNGQMLLLKPGEPLGAAFRFGHKKCLFGTTLEDLQRRTDEALITMRWPGQIEQIQRRAFERAQLPRGTVIAVRYWQSDQSCGSTGLGRRVRHGQLQDLSAGGMRIKAADLQELEIGRNYRCVFAPRQGKPAFVIDAILRHRETADHGRAAIGFQFIGLEVTSEGREQLKRLARLVHRFKSGRSGSGR